MQIYNKNTSSNIKVLMEKRKKSKINTKNPASIEQIKTSQVFISDFKKWIKNAKN